MLMRQIVNNEASRNSPIVSSLDSVYFISTSLCYFFHIITFFPYNLVVKRKQTIDGRRYKTSVAAVPRPLFKTDLA